MKNDSIMEEMYLETERRLKQMEQKEYEFPEKIKKPDVAAIVMMVAVSGILIILCKVGVIR